MRRLAALLDALEHGPGAAEAQAVLAGHFGAGPPAADAAWTLHLLKGHRPRPALSAAALRGLAGPALGLPDWVLDACEEASGEATEALALLMPASSGADLPPETVAAWLAVSLPALRAGGAAAVADWLALAGGGAGEGSARRWMLRLLTGAKLPRVDEAVLQRALAAGCGLRPATVARRLAAWPDAAAAAGTDDWLRLVAPDADPAGHQTPWWALAEAPSNDADVERTASHFGDASRWVALDEPRGGLVQCLVAEGRAELWTAADTLCGDGGPALVLAARHWPEGTRVLLHRAAAAGRRTAAQLQAVDLLALGGEDWRGRPWAERDAELAERVRHVGLACWPRHDAARWDDLDALRRDAVARGHAGLRLWRRDAAADTWCWTLPARCLPLLLLYAEDDGRGVFTLTPALWNRRPAGEHEVRAVGEAIARRLPPQAGGLQLMPVARAALPPSEDGMTPEWRVRCRDATVARMGPVRSLAPRMVADVAFEAVDRNARRRAGLQLRGARVLRWRDDLAPWQAASLDDLGELHEPAGQGDPT